MNEPITTPRKDMMAKIFRPALLALLAGILILQIIGLAASGKSSECKAALEYAQTLSETMATDSLASDYQSAVYSKAENINQQLFLSNEFNFLTLQKIQLQQAALLSISAACQ